jgi:hypothetical protein
MIGSLSFRGAQRGAGLWGTLFLFAVIGFVALLAIKCVPIYLNQLKITKAVHQVAEQNRSAGGEVDVYGIRSSLQKRWDIDDMDYVQPKDIQVLRSERGLSLSYDYEAKTLLFYNIFLVIHFAEDVPLRSGP